MDLHAATSAFGCHRERRFFLGDVVLFQLRHDHLPLPGRQQQPDIVFTEQMAFGQQLLSRAILEDGGRQQPPHRLIKLNHLRPQCPSPSLYKAIPRQSC